MKKAEPIVLLAAAAVLLLASGISPHDRSTWWMEIFPIIIAAPLLIATARRFPLTPLAYRLVFVHALILMLGGHYTYARVPLGFWLQDALHLGRNHYDRIGHFAQGFVPAIIAREILVRRTPLRPGGWLFFLVTCVCLSISACYEFIEWWAAVLGGSAADAFLGTQGDVWDTQWDMFMALIGAIMAQALLGRVHDRQLSRLAAAAGDFRVSRATIAVVAGWALLAPLAAASAQVPRQSALARVPALGPLPAGGKCRVAPTTTFLEKGGVWRLVMLDFPGSGRDVSALVDSSRKPVSYTDWVRVSNGQRSEALGIDVWFDRSGRIVRGSRAYQSSGSPSRVSEDHQWGLERADTARARDLAAGLAERCAPPAPTTATQPAPRVRAAPAKRARPRHRRH